MKKAVLAVAATALLAGSAVAADLPSRKAPPYIPPPPPPMWTGFYVGLNAGGTWADRNQVWLDAAGLGDPQAPPNESFGIAASVPTFLSAGNSGGFIGGGQIGYNWQFAGNFVAGVEADIQGIAASGGGSTSATGVSPVPVADLGVTFANASKRLDYLGTVRGRIGYLFTPSLLVYGTGGLAYGGVSFSTSLTSAEIDGAGGINSIGSGAAAFSDTRVGWTAGGGLEWMFWPNWSAKAEYLYYDLGSVASAAPLVVGLNLGAGTIDWAYSATARARYSGHVVRAGVNYHFNWGAAPVVAKY